MKKSYLFIISLLIVFGFYNSLSAQTAPVVISEVFYDSPLEEDFIASPDEHHYGEYIELYNASLTLADISGWKIADFNLDYTFPENTYIPSKSTILVAFRNKESFELHHLFPELTNTDKKRIFYQSRFWLSNQGEEISLYDKNRNLVDRMSYRPLYTVDKKMHFWQIAAPNGKGKNNSQLRSIHRKNIHTSHKGITPLLSDYTVGKPTPLSLSYNLPEVETLYLSDTNQANVDKSLTVGTLPGTPSVTPTGAANYYIPIDVPQVQTV